MAPMHKYYTNCDWLEDHVIEECFPEDGVPEDLNFEYLNGLLCQRQCMYLKV